MEPIIMRGKPVAEAIYNSIKQRPAFNDTSLVIASFSNDAASEIYMRNKVKAAEALGYDVDVLRLNPSHQPEAIAAQLRRTVADGIILQLPLPKHLKSHQQELLNAIDTNSDVDCLGEKGIGAFYSNANKWQVPCTAQAVMDILKFYGISLATKNVVVVGRSMLVGRPVAELMLRENATVTICHSATEDLSLHTKNADVIICAAGTPNLITADMVKEGVVIVDVSINKGADGKLCGDVDYTNVAPKCAAITPVPGGVGPVTVAELMANTLGVRPNLAAAKN